MRTGPCSAKEYIGLSAGGVEVVIEEQSGPNIGVVGDGVFRSLAG